MSESTVPASLGEGRETLHATDSADGQGDDHGTGGVIVSDTISLNDEISAQGGFQADTPSTVADTEDDHPVYYELLGRDYPLEADDEEIDIHTGRIKELTNLDRVPNLKRLIIVASLVEKLSGLEPVPDLEHLELYQAKLRRIENISHLKKLKTLDLSFNGIRQVCNLRELPQLEQLYLPNNKIEEVLSEEVGHLTRLTLLELGANRIRKVTGLENLVALEQLWLGKNKLVTMQVPPLQRLRVLDMRSNRLVSWDDSILELPVLEELYLSHNQLCDPPSEDFFVGKLRKLTALDLSANAITSLKYLVALPSLKELYLSENKLEDEKELPLLKDFKVLDTLYLQHNPFCKNLGPMYRNTTIQNCSETLLELDGNDIVRLF